MRGTLQLLIVETQVIVNEENQHDTYDFINKRLQAIKSQRSSGELEDLALIIGECPVGMQLSHLLMSMQTARV